MGEILFSSGAVNYYFMVRGYIFFFLFKSGLL